MPERYLDELRREARRLPLEAREALLEEAAEHLGNSIQARLELGMSPEAAQRESVEAFGTVRAVVRREMAVQKGRFQTLFLALATLSGVGWAFAILASPTLGSLPVQVVGIAFFVMLALFTNASKVRRPLRPLLVATAAFWALFALVGAWWNHASGVEVWFDPSLAALAFLAYLLLAYRMARPARKTA